MQKVLLDKVMKKLIIGLVGAAILAAGITYYKTDDPEAAWEVFTTKMKEVVNTICEYCS